ncbi:MAG: hypothetical protein U0169_13230 [Polyangiaceae bacterium]
MATEGGQSSDEGSRRSRPSKSPPSWASPPSGPLALKPRGDRPAPTKFRYGANAPYAIRWFGSTALFGHLRHLVASAVASESVDSRDWMRAQRAEKFLAQVVRVLGGDAAAPTLTEALDRTVWIDFVADTGDDRDVSSAVASMIFARYVTEDGRELPRGDVLLFGGDTAYPVSTADELAQRLTGPWNEVLHERPDGAKRVLLGVPGNHDWYDGLDGFARLFRRSAVPTREFDVDTSVPGKPKFRGDRKVGLVAKGLHLDEVRGSIGLAAKAWLGIRAFVTGEGIKRRKRLGLLGYEAVQECSYWSLPLAPGLDVWGADRQLRRIDFRQKIYFGRRLEKIGPSRILFCSADPAMAFGERNSKGARMLTSVGLELGKDPIFFLSGDMHHYERRDVGKSVHVIAGGGGAFLHGTRVSPSPSGPAACAYPDAATSRRLVLKVPVRVMFGSAGFLPHMAFAVIAILELMGGFSGHTGEWIVAGLFTVVAIVSFYMNVGHHRQHPRRVLAMAVPFGTVVGMGPVFFDMALHAFAPAIALKRAAVVVLYAFLGAFVFGLFLMTCVVFGFEHEQAFAALGHPGFKHFVRLAIHPDGRVEAFTIGKDDPLAPGDPVLIDKVAW